MDIKVVALVADIAALPELADDVDRFLEHQVADVRRRPALADHMLVEVLAGTETERESVVAHQPDRGGHLRDDRWMVTNGRARDHGHQLHLARPARHCS